MNVLVYSGPEVLHSSFARSLSLLKAALVPHYSVQPITLQSLISNPWSETCALLVFPACREQLSLPTPVRKSIRNYIESGGSLLGLRASARLIGSGFASAEVYESSLRFQDRASGTILSCTFIGNASESSTTVAIKSTQGDTTALLPVESAFSELSVPTNATNVQAFAHHDDARPAAIACQTGKGRVVIWGVDIASPSLEGEPPEVEGHRRSLLRESLHHLALRLPATDGSVAMCLLPQLLTCSQAIPTAVTQILESLSPVQSGGTIKDEHDTFALHTISNGKEVLRNARLAPSAVDTDTKHIIAFPDGQLPSPEDTPLFNISQYYTDLASVRSKTSSPMSQSDAWGIGEALLYGEVVTSTQTMLDKNHRFLSALPHPLLSLASHQIAGRGRGGNNWVSPSGCLQFSLLLRAPLRDVPAPRLVFVQYLVALAVVEACRSPDVLGAELGGQGGETTIVIGCGINVLNAPPIASLSQLGTPQQPLSMERTAAVIMVTFEPMWNTFLAERGSFSPFMDLYLERWLHSDQRVTITSTTPHRAVRIVGITEDHGLLRTVPERVGVDGQQYIDLQPDGNSFDLMAGLIMTKARKP
ncbi:hypothetical protein EUX98_g6992 [Antrodiella citrinella]|uniref:BPL/LPL catalytic domain-containing protein n=1 Tax=Antrodiella citrinella TaxID=2447956 RepID=A0A4S4MNG0_9APHY|nr:hypothetical protein EUX98_g6992 [Antrodiella citrinella]